MTVCIAAMAMFLEEDNKKYPVIIGASDRMITAPDFIEYEPQRSKISKITPHIVALSSADDVAMQMEILHRTESHFAEMDADNPDYYSVEKVAQVYSDNLVNYIREIKEKLILQSVGFTWESYMNSYSEELQSWFKKEMKRVFGATVLSTTSTIIAGVDETGAHLFMIDGDGYIKRLDWIGFAIIGIGFDHAASEFMVGGHIPSKSAEETLCLTYIAKRRAEVAPGVGRDTDLFYISQKRGYVDLNEKLDYLIKVYDSFIKKITKEKDKLIKLINKIFKEV